MLRRSRRVQTVRKGSSTSTANRKYGPSCFAPCRRDATGSIPFLWTGLVAILPWKRTGVDLSVPETSQRGLSVARWQCDGQARQRDGHRANEAPLPGEK